jgi:hypothetical protein
LGDEEFEVDVKERSGSKKQNATLKLGIDMGQLWKAICVRAGCVDEPEGRHRSRLMAEAAYLALEGLGIRQTKVAEYFEVEPSAVNMALKRLELRWKSGEGSKEKLLEWAKGLKETL